MPVMGTRRWCACTGSGKVGQDKKFETSDRRRVGNALKGDAMLPLLMLLACVVLRIVPHPWNFAPVGATSVFIGRTLPVRIGVPVLFAAMLLGDICLARLNGYSLFSAATPFVYAGFAVQLLLGR